MIEKVTHYKDVQELRIIELLKHFPMIPLVESVDFTTLGLRSETPTYGAKGIKQQADYTLVDKVVVRKKFDYQPEGLWITIEWLTNDDEVGLEKVEFKPLNIVEQHKINKANRDRSITYLQASAIGTPIESHVNALLKHYKNDIELFIQNNTDDFLTAINTENEALYVGYLNTVIEAPSDDYPAGKKVKDSIVQQIS